MTNIFGYIFYYGIYKPYSVINTFIGLITANTFDISKYPIIGEPDIEYQLRFYGYRIAEAVAAILWLQIIVAIILIHKQRKTQKMLRDLQSKLDKLQPPDPTEDKTTEDTESAE